MPFVELNEQQAKEKSRDIALISMITEDYLAVYEKWYNVSNHQVLITAATKLVAGTLMHAVDDNVKSDGKRDQAIDDILLAINDQVKELCSGFVDWKDKKERTKTNEGSENKEGNRAPA